MLPCMHFAQDDCSSDLLIRGYGDGVITIGNQQFARSLILTRDSLMADWRPQHVAELLHDDFVPILEIRPEVLVLGTGKALTFPSPALTARLLQLGIGVEIMDTAAACRTYNILMNEGRRVLAVILPI